MATTTVTFPLSGDNVGSLKGTVASVWTTTQAMNTSVKVADNLPVDDDLWTYDLDTSLNYHVYFHEPGTLNRGVPKLRYCCYVEEQPAIADAVDDAVYVRKDGDWVEYVEPVPSEDSIIFKTTGSGTIRFARTVWSGENVAKPIGVYLDGSFVATIPVAEGLSSNIVVGNGTHTIELRDTTEGYNYGWVRGFGGWIGGYRHSGTSIITEISQFPTKSMMLSATDVGKGYFHQTFYEFGITQPLEEEDLPAEQTKIPNNFRSYQYANCSNLQAPAREAGNDVATSIGNGYRSMQYRSCTALNNVARVYEAYIGDVTSIGEEYRDRQFYGCSSMRVPLQEASPMKLVSVGARYKAGQYAYCTSLNTFIDSQSFPKLTTINPEFHEERFRGCTSLAGYVPAEGYMPLVANIYSGFRNQEFQGCTGITRQGMESDLPSLVRIWDGSYRGAQYMGCSKLNTVAQFMCVKIPASKKYGDGTGNMMRAYQFGGTGFTAQNPTKYSDMTSVLPDASAKVSPYVYDTTNL
jgi:hypothetical protein